MIDTHDCILNGNTITIETANKSECDCSNVKLTLSTVCPHVCYNDKVHVKVDFDDVTNKPYALTYVDNMYKMLEDLGMDDLSGFVTNDELSGIGYALQSDVENEINDVVEVVVRDYALKDEIPSLEGYAKTTDIPDTSNFVTKTGNDIITGNLTFNAKPNFNNGINFYGQDIRKTFITLGSEQVVVGTKNFFGKLQYKSQDIDDRYMSSSQLFKTINGESILGDGDIEVAANVDTSNFATKDDVNTLSNNITNNYALKDEIPSLEGYAKTTDIPDTSNFARTDTANSFNGNNVFNYSDYDSGCATFNGRTTFKDEINIEIDAIPKEDISNGIQCDMKQTKGQVATLYTGHILPPVNDTMSHRTNVIKFGLNNNMRFVEGDGLYIDNEKLTDTYARKDEIPSLEGYAKTTDIPDTSNFATKDDVNALSNNITNNYALKDEIPDTSNLATKDEIVTEFKTINGETITGTGDIEIKTTIDLSNLFWVGTQDEYDALSDYTTYEFYMIKKA